MDSTEIVLKRITDQLEWLADHAQTNLSKFAYEKSLEIVNHERLIYIDERKDKNG